MCVSDAVNFPQHCWRRRLSGLGCPVSSQQGQSRLCLKSPYFSLNIWSSLRGIVGIVELGVAAELCERQQGLSCHCDVGPCKALGSSINLGIKLGVRRVS